MFKPTPEQQAIISAERGNLLVSAAAGSGKTAVLTDRIVSRIIAGELDVRGVLVMTFTEAAARNMKEKIEDKLRTALAGVNEVGLRRRILRQLSWLPGASISTIHAFCLDVIRNFYHCLKTEDGSARIEPGFSVDDGLEADLLLRESLEEFMALQYERIDRAEDGDGEDCPPDWQAAFYRLIDGYGSSRSDQPVRNLILGQLTFLRSLPDYEKQVDRWLADLNQAARDFSASPHMTALVAHLRVLLDRALEPLDELETLLAQGIRFIADNKRNQAYHNMFEETLQSLKDLDCYLNEGQADWDVIRSMTAGLENLSIPRASKNDSVEKSTFIDQFLQRVAEVIHCLAGNMGTQKNSQYFIFKTEHTFSQPAADIQKDLEDMLPAIRVLFELVLGLDRLYSQKKQALALIDFSDFEHLAIDILRQPEAFEYYRSRYDEIYVDEYQDTSSIQEEIISSLADGNCLMVGDIKQSIYRFRHARPGIFMNKAENYRAGRFGTLRELNKNFRSVAGILCATNHIFCQLMSKGAGEIDYDEHQALVSHRDNPEHGQHPVTLILANMAGETSMGDVSEQTPDLGRYQQETLAAADEMIRLHETGTPWSDMAVLTRTRSIGQACRAQLKDIGIPVVTDMPEPFLDMPVIRQIESLIHLMDNFCQDIPMAAVMRSDLFAGGFSDEEMARIRLENQHGYFHDAVLSYAASGSDERLTDRVSGFVHWIAQLREKAQVLSLGELVSLIYEDSGWLERLAAQPDGGEDIRRLNLFRQWADLFEARRPRGLSAFAAYLRSLHERGKLESPLAETVSEADAVRIMTIHGSKGLEFPVVFLVGTSYNLTPKDTRAHLLISETLGLGMDYVDPDQQISYPTHLKLAMIEQLRAAGLAEELRLLYVAMTRAMDRLILVGTVKLSEDKQEKRLARLIEQVLRHRGQSLPDHLVLAGSNYLDWILMALSRQSDLELGFLSDGTFPDGTQCFDDWTVVYKRMTDVSERISDWIAGRDSRAEEPERSGDNPEDLLRLALDDSRGLAEDEADLLNRTRHLMMDPYRYERAAMTPLKLSVSEMKRNEQADMAEEPADAGVRLANLPEQAADSNLLYRGINLEMHDWIEESDQQPSGPVDAGRLGTILHAFFRYMDVQAFVSDASTGQAEEQIRAMQKNGMISQGEADLLAGFKQHFADFAKSDLAAAMAAAQIDPRSAIYREMPFSLALPAVRVYPDCQGLGDEDNVLVQGMIDCWYRDSRGITLVDYKSDRLPADPDLSRAELEKRYRIQLDYYAQAVSAAAQQPVDRCLIWLIRQGRAVEVRIR